MPENTKFFLRLKRDRATVTIHVLSVGLTGKKEEEEEAKAVREELYLLCQQPGSRAPKSHREWSGSTEKCRGIIWDRNKIIL